MRHVVDDWLLILILTQCFRGRDFTALPTYSSVHTYLLVLGYLDRQQNGSYLLLGQICIPSNVRGISLINLEQLKLLPYFVLVAQKIKKTRATSD